MLSLGRRPLLLLSSVGSALLMHSPARLTLERVILPYLAAQDRFRTILFVGCDWYTWRYAFLFEGKEYWTIEKLRANSWLFGGSRAIPDTLCNLERHFRREYFDLIICNGVLGWGLDHPEEAESALDQCFNSMQRGGLFILGWSDFAGHRPIDVATSASLGRFEPHVFPPLATSQFETGNEKRHLYSFYTKR